VRNASVVTPGLVPGIHVLAATRRKTWMAGHRPAEATPSFGRLCPAMTNWPSVLSLEMTDMLLRVELEPDALDQIELGLEEVDVVLLVLHQALEQVA
jgi:hypothetical protein